MKKFISLLKNKLGQTLKRKDFKKDLERLPPNLSKEEIYRLAYINGFWAGTTEAVLQIQEMQ